MPGFKLHRRGRVEVVRTHGQWRKRRKEIKLLGGGFSEAHESATAGETYLSSPDFVLCKLLFHTQSIFTLSVSQR